MHDIALLDDVLLAFESQATSLLRTLLAIARNVILEGNDLRANKTTLEVCVDFGGGTRRGCADLRRPGSHFFWPGREEGLQAKQLVATANDSIESWLVQAKIRKKLDLVLIVQQRDLCFDCGANGNHFGAFRGSQLVDGVKMRIVLEATFIDVSFSSRSIDRIGLP
jgi:hypothetical protein